MTAELTLKKLCKKQENKQMSENYYLDVQLKLRDESDIVLTKPYFQGAIDNSLRRIFGEIGGETEWEFTKFDAIQKRAIVKVRHCDYQKTRTAITLIGYFQEIPCHFHVLKTSRESLDFVS